MRAVRIREPGPPEVLESAWVPRPEPGPGAVRVRVAASGVNRADLLQRLGRYPAPKGYPQDIPGMEFAGMVEALGPGVGDEWLGRPVMGILGGGGYAEYVVVPTEQVVPVPAPLDPVAAGAVPEVFMTAYDAVFLQAGLESGQTLLVHAAGSGVGTAAIQLARRAGATVIGTSRTAEKLVQARPLGLEHAVAGEDGWADRVLEITGGRGVDVVLDLVGGPYLDGNVKAVASHGRIVVVGVPGGAKGTLDLATLMRKRALVRGTVLRSRSPAEKATLARSFEVDVLPGFQDGSLVPVVDRTFPAARAAEAHRFMETNGNFGKILLTW